MHGLIPFLLAVGDLGTRLALTIIFFVVNSWGISWAHCFCIYLKRMHEVQPAEIDRFTRYP